jgi:catechol 2,3-dioxygenase-like lactoylglutathione lyase family enzyme
MKKGSKTRSWEIRQVGVVVRDMDKAVKRLSSLGMGPFESWPLPPDREEWYRGQPHKAKVKISMARVGDVQLELIEPLEKKSVHKEFLDSKGEGIQHVMFAVKDLDKELARLTKEGAIELLHAKMPGDTELAYLDLNVGGIIIELVQKR